MVTAKDQSEDVVQALKIGANDYITKPIDFPVLRARVQTQLRLKRLSELKDEFLSIASHDLKNPLSCIMGFASVIESMVSPGEVMTEEIIRFLSKISSQTKVMQRIIEDFLDFQAMEDGQIGLKPGNTDLNAISQSVLERNAAYAEKKFITLDFEPEKSLPLFSADSSRLEQVVQNFVSNAIKFSDKGNRVLVRTGKSEDSVIFEAIDSGPGLRDEDMKKLFVKYARLSNRPTGGEKSSGLGLAICKKIIEMHGGAIGARNNPDSGATFWFRIPLSSGSS